MASDQEVEVEEASEDEAEVDSTEEVEEESEEQSSRSLLTRDELLELYEDEGMSFTEIAHHYDVTPSTISYYARKYNIETSHNRTSFEGSELDSEEYLQEKYWDEEMTMQEIADEFGCSDGTVMRYMRKYEITPRRQGSSDSEPSPFQIVESVKGVGPAKIQALEERGFESDEDLVGLPVMSDPEDEDAEAGLAETHGWSESLAERVVEQLEIGEPVEEEDDEE